MLSSTESCVTSACNCNYSNIPEVNFVDPPTNDDTEAATKELHLGYAGRLSGISFRMLATASLLLGATLASFTWAMSSGSLSSESLVQADGSDGLIGLAETANSNTEGDVRIMVCRDTNCDKFHPHGLVHEYTAFLNKCSAISSSEGKQTNGKYQIIGADASTIRPDMILTAQHCNNDNTPHVYHGPFSLTVGKFTDCCSFEHGGCGFKCIVFALNEVPPAFGGDGMDGGDIRIKVCRNEDCDKLHPHGLVHEYTANLNTCAKVPEDTNIKTNGEYQIIGATPATLAEGTVLTAQQCGNTTEKVYHGAFSLIVGTFTDCCSFRHGGCGFKCITYKQAYGEPATNGTMPNETMSNETMPNETLIASENAEDVECEGMPEGQCTLVVTMADNTSLADLKSLADKYASTKVMENLKIVSIDFGMDKEKCCKAAQELQTNGDPNVESVEFDAPMNMMTR